MKKLTLTIMLMLLYSAKIASGYDDEVTHRALTERAIPISTLSAYLKNSLGFSEGSSALINGKTVSWWLREGSYLEDAEPCRRANHMHNPLLPWDQSQMSDDPWWTSACYAFWYKRYSNVTWATGFLAPAPDGQKASFTIASGYCTPELKRRIAFLWRIGL